MIGVKGVIDQVALQLYDATNVSWTENELLGWFAEALRAIASIDPRPFLVTEWHTLTAGFQHPKPSGTEMVVGGVAARASSGAPATGVTPFDYRQMLAINPKWATDTPAVPRQIAVSPDRSTFYTYPPALADAQMLLEMVEFPEVPGDAGDAGYATATIPTEEYLKPAIVDYLLYRAYSKNVDVAGHAELAALHEGRFRTGVGGSGDAAA